MLQNGTDSKFEKINKMMKVDPTKIDPNFIVTKETLLSENFNVFDLHLLDRSSFLSVFFIWSYTTIKKYQDKN